jgi:hypothetical protein
VGKPLRKKKRMRLCEEKSKKIKGDKGKLPARVLTFS